MLYSWPPPLAPTPPPSPSSQIIVYTIRVHGALVFAVIMTTRNLLSIVLSCLIFGHPLTWAQWAAAAAVFGAIYWDNLTKPRRAARKEKGEGSDAGMVVKGAEGSTPRAVAEGAIGTPKRSVTPPGHQSVV